MRFIKALRTAIVVVVCLSMLPVTALAASFKDVASSHWAYAAISEVSDKGLMVGDASGNFKPNDYIDKFETSKILAKAAGYKYVNLTSEEKTYIDRAYDKNKEFLAQFNKVFAKWNTSADREVAYLLEKEILTVDDLNQFVIKNTSGTEQLRALSRQEAAVFLVRMIGKKTEALSASYKADFNDDSSIADLNKPYVYYLKSANIVTGDTDGKFNPNGAVTKASFAVMLSKCLTLTSSSIQTTAVSQISSSAAQVSKVETITGTFDKHYSALKGVQIISSDGSKNIYKLTDGASIYIDGYLKTAADLAEGMTVICVVNNGELVDLKAQSITTGSPGSTSNASSTNATVQPEADISLSKLEGIVASKADEATGKTVSIEVRMLNPKGEIITDTKSYSLAEDCKITRGDDGTESTFDSIVKGDVVTAEISGSKAYSLKLEEKNRTIKDGTLIEKKYIETTSTPILVIKDQKGVKMELRVADSSVINRKETGKTTWNNLRIGDGVDVTCEYDVIQELNAYGIRSTVEGTVEEIVIKRDSGGISVKDSSGVLTSYGLITGTMDVYSLRIGMKVRLSLDSMEVETVSILEEAAATNITGYIHGFKSDSFSIKDSLTSYSSVKDIKIDSNTVFLDSKTGNKIRFDNLYENLKVYVVLSNVTSNLAKTVTVLTE